MSIGDIATRPHSIFRDAETVDDRVDVLADCYADVRTWIAEDADELESLRADVRRLKAQVAKLQKQRLEEEQYEISNRAGATYPRHR